MGESVMKWRNCGVLVFSLMTCFVNSIGLFPLPDTNCGVNLELVGARDVVSQASGEVVASPVQPKIESQRRNHDDYDRKTLKRFFSGHSRHIAALALFLSATFIMALIFLLLRFFGG